MHYFLWVVYNRKQILKTLQYEPCSQMPGHTSALAALFIVVSQMEEVWAPPVS